MSAKKSKSPPPPMMRQAPVQGLDLQSAFSKLVGNTATIAQHVMALKLVAKGIDVEPIEKANAENQNLLVALASFMTKMGPPGKKLNRAQRRKIERENKKQNRKRRKK